MARTDPIRVLVVDDSAFMRKAISTMLNNADGIEVIGTANNGVEGLEQTRKLNPDVITLDLEMPQMDGLTALRELKKIRPVPVLVCSSLTTEGSHMALKAMAMGAADVIAKNVSQISLDVVKIEQDLVAKVRAIAGGQVRRPTRISPAVARPTPAPVLRKEKFDVIVIGSSTGGPPVLETILTPQTAAIGLPIIIAQHMPPVFTHAMAERLDELCKLNVVEAEHGLPLLPGHVYVGKGGQHVRIQRAGLAKLKLEVSPVPRNALYKPSVDELFTSAAKACGVRTLAIVLTGMGEDGLIGGRELHKSHAPMIAQDHASCVVYGMPKAVNQAGLTCASIPPKQIAQTLINLGGAVRASA
jgi:two-component system chemotaxis response regulator CheB